MLLKTTIFLILIPLAVECRVIEILDTKKNFSLEINENKITVLGYLVNLSFEKSKCNEVIFSKFKDNIEVLLKTKPLKKSQEKDNFKFNLEGNTYFESYNSKLGRGLLLIPTEVQRMKFQDQTLCRGKKN